MMPASANIENKTISRLALSTWLMWIVNLSLWGPLEIWARNAPFFAYSGWLHALVLLCIPLVLTVIAYVFWRVLPRAIRPWLAYFISALAAITWVNAYFLFQDSLQLNGRSEGFQFSSVFGNYELPVIMIALLGLIAFTRRFPAEMSRVFLIMLIIQGGMNLWRLAENSTRSAGSFMAPQTTALWEFGTKDNIIVILLDTLQAEVARKALEQGEIAQDFRDFTFYENATGVAPTTYPSMPSIHSGTLWDPEKSLSQQYQTLIKEHSFLGALAEAHYKTVQINPIFKICTKGTELCIDSAQVINGRGLGVLREASYLLDLSLLRAAPFFWKNNVYNQGSFWLSHYIIADPANYLIQNDVLLLNQWADNARIGKAEKAAKFIHSMTTHPPHFIQEDCITFSSAGKTEYDVIAAKCALQSVAKLMKKMKALSIYDAATILVFADHGGMRPLKKYGNESEELARLMSYANPTLMLKRPQAPQAETNNAMRVEGSPVSLLDIAPTICEIAGVCTTSEGFILPKADQPKAVETKRKSRPFHYYTWAHENWFLSHVPNVQTYSIADDLRDFKSWRKELKPKFLEWGKALLFNDPATGAYLGLGWHAVEPWGRWSADSRASLRFALPETRTETIVLQIKANALLFGAHKKQTLRVSANGVFIENWEFNQIGVTETKILSIPRAIFASHIVDGQMILDIDFDSDDLKTPKEIGVNEDTRRLGIGMIELKLMESPQP